ncbi:hypothetical protein HDU97_005608 [Phlyctochytrium planicorne]|nr:hypothetical protein HDU97_005608 [Phlyctochytrium planicorne]
MDQPTGGSGLNPPYRDGYRIDKRREQQQQQQQQSSSNDSAGYDGSYGYSRKPSSGSLNPSPTREGPSYSNSQGYSRQPHQYSSSSSASSYSTHPKQHQQQQQQQQYRSPTSSSQNLNNGLPPVPEKEARMDYLYSSPNHSSTTTSPSLNGSRRPSQDSVHHAPSLSRRGYQQPSPSHTPQPQRKGPEAYFDSRTGGVESPTSSVAYSYASSETIIQSTQQQHSKPPQSHHFQRLNQDGALTREISISSSSGETTTSSLYSDDDNRNSFNIFAANKNVGGSSRTQSSPKMRIENHEPITTAAQWRGERPRYGSSEEADAGVFRSKTQPDSDVGVFRSKQAEQRYSFDNGDETPYTAGKTLEREGDYEYDDYYNPHEEAWDESRESYLGYAATYGKDDDEVPAQLEEEGEESEEDDVFLLQYNNNPYEDILGGYDDYPDVEETNPDAQVPTSPTSPSEDRDRREREGVPSSRGRKRVEPTYQIRNRFSFEADSGTGDFYEYSDYYGDYSTTGAEGEGRPEASSESLGSTPLQEAGTPANDSMGRGTQGRKSRRPSLPSLVTTPLETASSSVKPLPANPDERSEAETDRSEQRSIPRADPRLQALATAPVMGSGPAPLSHPNAPNVVQAGSAHPLGLTGNGTPIPPNLAMMLLKGATPEGGAAFPSRGSSHVISQHLARTHSTTRSGPSDKKAIREALAAAKKLTSTQGGETGSLSSSAGSSAVSSAPGSPSLGLKAGAGHRPPVLALAQEGDGASSGARTDQYQGMQAPTSAPQTSLQNVAFISPTHPSSAHPNSKTPDIFSAPVTLESTIPYSPLNTPITPLPLRQSPSMSLSHSSSREQIHTPPLPPRPLAGSKTITPEKIESLLETGRKHLLCIPAPSDPNQSESVDSFQLAIDCWNEAASLAQSVGDSFREARALNNIGCAYRRARRDKEAWDCLDRAWSLAVTALEEAITQLGEDPLAGVGIAEDDEAMQGGNSNDMDSAPFDDADEEDQDVIYPEGMNSGGREVHYLGDNGKKARVDTREVARRRRLRRVLVALRVNMHLQTTGPVNASMAKNMDIRGDLRKGALAIAKTAMATPTAAVKALKLLGVGGSESSLGGSGVSIERSNSNVQAAWQGSGRDGSGQSGSSRGGSSTLERMQTWSGGSRPQQRKGSNNGETIMNMLPGKLTGALGFSNSPQPQDSGRDKALPPVRDPAMELVAAAQRLRQIGPPLYVLCMDICTSLGNAHFAAGKYLNAMAWHQSCLDLAQDAFLKWPLPVRAAEAMAADQGAAGAVKTEISMKLSYLHRSCIIARSRSFGHLGLCLQRLGESHRAVKFHQRAITALNVAGPQTQLNAPVVRASLVGNLAGAQFEVGRIPEAARGLADAVRRFAGCGDRIGLSRAMLNAAACWIEGGRLGMIVSVVAGQGEENLRSNSPDKTDGQPPPVPDKDKAPGSSSVYVPMRKASIATMMADLGASGLPSANHPGYKTIQRVVANSGPPGIETLRRAVSNSSMVNPHSKSSSGNNSPPIGLATAEGNLMIPPRSQSAPVIKEMSKRDEAIISNIERARARGLDWLVDILGSIKILLMAVDEARTIRDVECEGLARFNIASGLILLRLPGRAARVLQTFTTLEWGDVMCRGDGRRVKIRSSPLSWHGPDPTATFFNFIQLLFVASVQYLESSKSNSVVEQSAAEANAIQCISKVVSRMISPAIHSPPIPSSSSPPSSPNSPSGSAGQSPSARSKIPNAASVSSALSKNSTALQAPIDPGILISALKRCLEWFDGSPLGPSAKPNLHLPGAKGSSDFPGSPVRKRGFSSSKADGGTLWSSLPSSSRPRGSTTSGTTRVCLALSRSLVAVFAAQVAPRRVAMARDEAKRWVGIEASMGLNNAATAAAASRRSKSRSTVVAGSGLDSLLISAVAETGEVHGTLSLEVGAVACDLEDRAAANWDMDAPTLQSVEKNTVLRLVRLAAKKVRVEVVQRVRAEEVKLKGLLDGFM